MIGTAIGVLSILDALLDMDDKNTQRNQQIRAQEQELALKEKQAKVDRNVQYINAAVDVLSKGFDIYSKYKTQQRQQPASAVNNNSVGSLPIPPPPPPANYLPQPKIEIDYNSVYFDKQNNIMSASVIDKGSEEFHSYAYYLQNISDSQRNIFESVDGNQWIQVGVLNSKTAAEDIGTHQAGGYIFGEIFKAVLKQNSRKMPPPVPQTPQIERSAPSPQVNKISYQKKSSQVSQSQQNSQVLPSENDFDENSANTVSVEDYEEALAAFTDRVHEMYGNFPHVYFCGDDERAMNKIISAIKAYAPLSEYGEYPILSFDDTLFGGGEDGFLISDEALYFHNSFESVNYRFSREQIYSITNDYNNLCIWINKDVRLSLSLLNKDQRSFDAMINMIKDCLRL